MWNKFGLKQILNNENGTFVFKFNNAQGLQTVIESGPWIVNNKPMVVQKWSTSINMNTTEPTTLPIWIKLTNLPLEAWSTKGLSALASRIGKPLIMDAMTTKMCTQGVGRLGYARVLVEADVSKGLNDYIDVLYQSKEDNMKFMKKVHVIYDWKPPMCEHCKVFGHSFEKCSKRDRVEEQRAEDKVDEEGFVQVNNKKHSKNGGDKKVQQPKDKGVAHAKHKYVQKEKQHPGNTQKETKQPEKTQASPSKTWKVDKEVMQAVKVTASKYAVLENQDEDIEEVYQQALSDKEKDIVNKYVDEKYQPDINITEKWKKEMFRYFKDRWEEKYGYNKNVNMEESVLNEVYADKSKLAKFMTDNEISGLGNDNLFTNQ